MKKNFFFICLSIFTKFFFIFSNNNINIKYKEVYFSTNCLMLIKCNQEFSFNVFKIALLAIAKMENKYIKEFVEHYFFIGVNKIIIYDNNEINGEKINEVLDDYIKSNFVTIHNFRGIKNAQMRAYNEMYKKYRFEFDYVMFFDVDEFLNLIQYKNIHYFLRDKKYDKCDVIHIQWVVYDDNDLIHYDNRPLNVRFTRPNFHNFTDNLLVKSIFKTYNNISFKNSHSPRAKNIFKCDINGNKNEKIVPNNNIAIESNLTVPYIKHFQCKTVEEFFLKLLRGDVYYSSDPLKIFTKKKFFTINKWTQEKEDIANEIINKYKNFYKIKYRFLKKIIFF